jgi:hypothetical protein
MLSKYLAIAASARSLSYAVLSSPETVGEAGRILQAGSLASFHCEALGGGFPFDNLDWCLQNMNNSTKNQY